MNVLVFTSLLMTLVSQNVAATTCAEQFRKNHKSGDQRKEIATILEAATILKSNSSHSSNRVNRAQKIIDEIFTLYFLESPLTKQDFTDRLNIINLEGVEKTYCLPSYIFTKGELCSYYFNYTDNGKLRIDVLIEDKEAKLRKNKNITSNSLITINVTLEEYEQIMAFLESKNLKPILETQNKESEVGEDAGEGESSRS